MGTRHLIKVISHGELKVAQYGQWDGYPSGQGMDICHFLNMIKLDEFQKNVDKCTWINAKHAQRRVAKALDPYGTGDYTHADMNSRFPEYSRDSGANILWLIAKEPRELVDDSDFEEDTVFCEYVYTLNLDDKSITVKGGDFEVTVDFSGYNANFVNGLEDNE